MKRIVMAAALLAAGPALAEPFPYAPYDGPQPHLPMLLREVYLGADGADKAAKADLAYVDGMRAHHQGAVTMAQAYLGDPEGRHPLMTRLARAIIHNQEFELAILDDVERHALIPPRRIGGGPAMRLAGWAGLADQYRFIKYPPPGFLELWQDRTPTSAADVAFAKGMIIHHQAAVEMARAFNRDPAADNRIIKALNRDIDIDQSYEIRLLERLIARFPGDPGSVEPVEVHGMPDHHGH